MRERLSAKKGSGSARQTQASPPMQTLLSQSRLTSGGYSGRGEERGVGGLRKGRRPGFFNNPSSVGIDHRRRSGESRNPLYAFCLSSEFPRIGGHETPSFIHPHPQMDSGFRRNDDQKRGAKPPSHIERHSLGHHFPLKDFFIGHSPRDARSLELRMNRNPLNLFRPGVFGTIMRRPNFTTLEHKPAPQ